MSDKIKFSELVKSFAEANGLTQQKSEAMIRGVFNLLIEDLENEGKASITNFGSFELKDVAERTGVNPQTGEEIVIPAHKKVSFKPFKALEGSVNAPFAHLEAKLIGETSDAKDKPETDVPKQEEPPTSKASIEKEKEDFEDPFESVIEEKNDSAPEALEVEEEEIYEEPEDTKAVPPVYKAPGSEKSNSGGMWLIIVLLLIAIGVGGWYFFLRDSGGAEYENQVAEQEPAQTEQNDPVQQAPITEPEETVAQTEASTSTTTSENEGASAKESPAPEEVDQTSPEMTTYTIRKDEWMWDISREVYGEPYLWPLIFEANKDVNNDPNLVEPANTLNIPALEGNASALTKTDYANLARASKMVSDAYSNAGNSERAAEYLRFAKKYERQSKN